MKAWEIVSDGGIDALALNDRAIPEPGPGEVRVRIAASSVNYRDLSTIEDPTARNLPYPTVPNSDGAGEVTAVGPGVARFKQGDRVMGCFFQRWPAGEITPEAMASALGGAIDGVLAEEVVLREDGMVRIPDHLSYEEAATLPCAAVTAWHALTEPRPVAAGETVLLLGTGGVSVFAQQFCNLLGARTIVVSSTDDKIARIRDLGAADAVNYRTTPDWHLAVRELAGGDGVDRVIEVGGPGTLERSIAAVRVAGQISLIGVLTGGAGQVVPTDIMRKSLTVRGIYVGSRQMFEDMAQAIGLHRLTPVIDTTFAFDDAREAYHRMRGAGHFGKLVIRL